MDQSKKWSRALALVLLVALGLRVGWAISRPVGPSAIDALPDQRDYLSLAQNLLGGRGLEFLDKRFADRVRAFRTPGYPLFLAACGANVRAARVVQACLDTSTVFAIYLLAGLLVPGRRKPAVPVVAAGLVAVNPYLIYFCGLLLSETLFTCMMAWAMVLLVQPPPGPGRRIGLGKLRWLAGGAVLAASVLVRPSAIGLPVVLGIVSALVNRARLRAYEQGPAVRRRRWSLPIGATMVLLTVLALLPWALRNRAVLGRWIWLDTNGGFTLYDGYNPDATGASDQSFVDREPELQVLGEWERSQYLSRKAQAYVRDHPGRVWELAGAKLGRTWSPIPLSSEYGRTGYRLVALAYTVPFYVLVVAGLLWADVPRSAKLLLLAPAVYFSIVHALTVGSLRYRIPAEPPMTIIAAGVIAARGARPHARRH